ncbi:hypothetical protein HOK51_02635 [Candidatus Woesearchaeota archaeon]|jgi:hypothetical protein|nr:hypothetical protein [Candidatus Woesearchaeota archaeon]MBT6518715.1 hypothetical protein [Candidatus Woesearchaeota archaeon]MBT7368363.1 hypothetical protein [Candidatus Woesearchaeota archaeon]
MTLDQIYDEHNLKLLFFYVVVTESHMYQLNKIRTKFLEKVKNDLESFKQEKTITFHSINLLPGDINYLTKYLHILEKSKDLKDDKKLYSLFLKVRPLIYQFEEIVLEQLKILKKEACKEEEITKFESDWKKEQEIFGNLMDQYNIARHENPYFDNLENGVGINRREKKATNKALIGLPIVMGVIYLVNKQIFIEITKFMKVGGWVIMGFAAVALILVILRKIWKTAEHRFKYKIIHKDFGVMLQRKFR